MKGVVFIRDCKNDLICKATTGRGNKRMVLVCSTKFASILLLLKNLTIATLTAISTESTSFP